MSYSIKKVSFLIVLSVLLTYNAVCLLVSAEVDVAKTEKVMKLNDSTMKSSSSSSEEKQEKKKYTPAAAPPTIPAAILPEFDLSMDDPSIRTMVENFSRIINDLKSRPLTFDRSDNDNNSSNSNDESVPTSEILENAKDAKKNADLLKSLFSVGEAGAEDLENQDPLNFDKLNEMIASFLPPNSNINQEDLKKAQQLLEQMLSAMQNPFDNCKWKNLADAVQNVNKYLEDLNIPISQDIKNLLNSMSESIGCDIKRSYVDQQQQMPSHQQKSDVSMDQNHFLDQNSELQPDEQYAQEIPDGLSTAPTPF